MNEQPEQPALLEWATRTTGCERIERYTVHPLSGGAVSSSVQRITLQLSGSASRTPRDPAPTEHDAEEAHRAREVQVVRKHAFPHEIAGLAVAQAIRPAAPAIPELITSGSDQDGPWLITPYFSATPLAEQDTRPPASLFTSLARLHAHFHGAANVPAGLPHVDARWWRRLCQEWVLPQVTRHRDRHPVTTITRASTIVADVAAHPAIERTLGRLTPTLLHGDVHPGNVLVHGHDAWLIDWGSCRVGPAMLDLANLVAVDSEEFAIYRQAWEASTRIVLDPSAAALGYRWAALQIPVQYLPWTIENATTDAVETALDQAEQALAAL